MTRTELDRLLAHEQARRLGDLYESLEKLIHQKIVSKVTHAAAVRRLIAQYGSDNVARMLRVLENDMKGDY